MNVVLNQALNKSSLIDGPGGEHNLNLASIRLQFALRKTRGLHVARNEREMASFERKATTLLFGLGVARIKRKASAIKR
tara:strand:- start:6 stop:242 length:237 start_codon:yes stop_codon:yes gene_type:complete